MAPVRGMSMGLPGGVFLLCLVVWAALCAGGCGSRAGRLQAYYKQAGTARSAAASAMVADWRAKKTKLDDCLNLAFAKLEADEPGATAFAGAVLDMVAALEKELPRDAEYELFWVRIGGLAGQAAERAYSRGDMAEARTLVLGGGQRWQNEAFWRRHVNHDAMCAYILYNTGEGKEALRRLQLRGDLDGPTQKAYDDISRAVSRGGGG